MGVFDFLFGKSDPYEKQGKALTNMYVQPNEREFIISQLRDDGTEKACQILLTRFSQNAPNTTVDLKEKETVYKSLVLLGKETELDVAGIVKKHLKATEDRVNWPLKILTDLLTEEQLTEFIVELLSGLDTLYQRDPEKKHELLLRALEHQSPELSQQVIRFFDDANDTVRFAAIRAAFHQQESHEIIDALTTLWLEDDSIRNVKEIAQGFADNQEWLISKDKIEPISAAMPDGFAIHSDGYVYISH